MIVYAAILGGIVLGGTVNTLLKHGWRRLRAPRPRHRRSLLARRPSP
jgi:hypothetical protein